MSTVFFKVTIQQDKEIKKFMDEEGYTSKSEFFRFLIKYYKYQHLQEQKEFEREVDELKAVLDRLDKEGKLNQYGTPEEQLADL
jgi:metal-responsive CopG/Arc/MetJ family transcriptional regulator